MASSYLCGRVCRHGCRGSVIALFVALVVGAGTCSTAALAAMATEPAPRQVAFEDLDRFHVEIFMTVRATREEIANVRTMLMNAGEAVQAFAYLDKQDAYTEFKRIFRQKPKLVGKVKPSDLPVSFRVMARKPILENALEVRDQAEVLPGVDDVPLNQRLSKQDAAEREAINVKCGSDPNRDLEAFLEVAATPDDERRIQDAIRALPGVTAVRFISRDEALAKFRCIFAGAQEVQSTSAAELPSSFEVTLAPGTRRSTLIHAIQAMRGVTDVAAAP